MNCFKIPLEYWLAEIQFLVIYMLCLLYMSYYLFLFNGHWFESVLSFSFFFYLELLLLISELSLVSYLCLACKEVTFMVGVDSLVDSILSPTGVNDEFLFLDHRLFDSNPVDEQ